VDEFLFGSRRGFCEHYASAFVVILRAAGIPARVVTGYQGGSINPNGNYMIVRQSDAHAWAEAIVGGQWRRFDPTAAVAPSRIQLGLGGSLPATERIPMLARLDESFLKSLQLSWDAINHDWRRNVIGFNFDRQRALWREWQLNTLAPWQITALVAAIGFGVDRRIARVARVAAPPAGSRACAVGSRVRPPRSRRTAARGVRGTARLRRRARVALAAVRQGLRRHRRLLRGAQVRPGVGARRHHARAGVGAVAPSAARCASCRRPRRCAAPCRSPPSSALFPHSSASRSSPRRFNRCRSFSSASDLDLSHALASDADLAGELLQRRDFAIVEPVAALDHRPLPLVQLLEPHPDPRLDLRVVQHDLGRERISSASVSPIDAPPSRSKGASSDVVRSL
jgi:hypothetical protein